MKLREFPKKLGEELDKGAQISLELGLNKDMELCHLDYAAAKIKLVLKKK